MKFYSFYSSNKSPTNFNQHRNGTNNNHHQHNHFNKNQNNQNGHNKKNFNKNNKVNKRELPENNNFFCEVCDRGFKTDEKYQEHCATHRTVLF